MTETDLHAMADGELTEQERQAVAESLSDNPELQAEYAAITSLKKTLKDRLPTHECSQTWSNCVARLDEIDGVERTEAIVSKYSYALAGLLCIAIVSAAYLNRVGGGVMDASAMHRSLTASVAGTSGFEVPDWPRAHEWLRKELNTQIPNVRPNDLRLWRVDTVNLESMTIGRYIYSDGNTNYILLVAPGVTKLPGPELPGYPGFHYERLDRGLNVISWCEGNIGFALAAQKPIPTLMSLIE